MVKDTVGRKSAKVPLEIEVRNFGPISRGKFRLRPLTVFVGPNNSGKTFAAMLAHSVISSRGETEHPLDYARWIRRELRSQRLKPFVAGMVGLIESASDTGTTIPSKYTDAVQELVHGRRFKKSVLGTLRNNFGSNLNRLVRAGQHSSTIKVKYHIDVNVKIAVAGDPAVEISHMDIAYSIKNQNGNVSIYEASEKVFDKRVDSELIDRSVRSHIDMLSHHLKFQKNSGLYWLLYLMKRMEYTSIYLPRSYYLPAARSGILSAHGPIVSNMVKDAGLVGTETAPYEPVSGVVSEYLGSLVRMSEYAPPANGKNGQEMFKDLFGGSLEVQRPKIGLPRIIYKAGSTSVPLRLMSSGITETAPLQLFLHGVTPRKDVLILEEPEAHLHPENQAKLAKHIVRLVNSGVYVLLITHSVYFLEQLSMFVRMSKIPINKRKKLGYSKGDCLEDDYVAPYLFKRTGPGAHSIQEMEHTPEDGITQGEFDRIIEVMANKEMQIDSMLDEA